MPVGESAYVPLANITLSSSAASVTFSSISQSYRDLVLITTATTTGTAFSFYRFNGDSGGNYFYVTAGSNSNLYNGGSNIRLPIDSVMETSPAFFNQINIMDYSSTNKLKAGLIKSNNYNETPRMAGFQWNSTAAITSITFTGNNNPFAAGSTFALYGVSA